MNSWNIAFKWVRFLKQMLAQHMLLMLMEGGYLDKESTIAMVYYDHQYLMILYLLTACEWYH